MKLLMLTCYYEPEQAASYYLTDNLNEAFASAGIESVVYTPTPTRGISKEVRTKYKRRKRETLQGGMRTVHRFPMYGEGKNVVMRALRYTLICICHFFFGCFASDARKCQAIYVVSTPPIQGALAALVKKVRHIPFIYGLQDIFPDSLVSTGIARQGGIAWKIGRVIENFTYRNADKIIVISEDFKRNIMAKGVPVGKIEVIPNWVDDNTICNIPRTQNILVSRYGLDPSKFYITYCGNIGLTQNLDMLLDVAKTLETEDDIHFLLIGNGSYREQLEQKINGQRSTVNGQCSTVNGQCSTINGQSSIKNVTLLPFQPYEDIAHVFSLGDASLVISKPGTGASSVPSKTWSIMAAARPVIASFDDGALRNIIEHNNCGIFIPADDREAFRNAIIRLLADHNLCQQMGINGQQFVTRHLSRHTGTRRYVEVIKSITLGNKS